MIVDDEAMIAMLLEDMLADLGYQVVGPFGRLAEAIEAARQEPLDAAILDVNLGGQPVFPVAEVLAGRDIPFVFATGYGDATLDGPWSGRPVLGKPFQGYELEKVLARLLAR
jgi:DNA-binding response OmpR family regulator